MSQVNYHAWTHRSKAQGGTDPIGHLEPWIVLANGVVTLAGDGTAKQMPWEDLYYDPQLVSQGAIFDWRQETVNGTDDTWILSTEVIGWYGYEYRTHWEQSPTSTDALGFAWQRVSTDPDTVYAWQDNDFCVSRPWPDSSDTDWQFNTYLKDHGRIHTYGGGRDWLTHVRQETGVDRVCEGLYLKVWFLGDDAEDSDDSWVTESVS